MSVTSKTFLRWGLGFLFSVLFIWGVTAVFTTGVSPKVWDAAVGRYVNEPGSVLRNRKEGWAELAVGLHGLTVAGEDVLKAAGPKFFLWGDSYAEGQQVAAEERAANVYNREAAPGAPRGITVADSGLSMADFVFYLPRYEALSDDVVAHVFLLAGMRSVIPGRHLDCHSRFELDPMRFDYSECPPSGASLEYATLVSSLHLDFLHGIYKTLAGYDFRFSLGNMTEKQPVVRSAAKPLSDEQLTRAWRFLLGTLRKETGKRLAFIYVPLKPSLAGGHILRKDGESGRKELFARTCREFGVDFIDLTASFDALYETRGKLAQGFFNTPQGQGHLNAYGQGLIADGLRECFAGAAK